MESKKNSILILFLLIFNIINVAAEIPLDTLKNAVLSVLVKEERFYSMSEYEDISSFPDVLIKNVKTHNPITPKSCGIFSFEAFSEHSFVHFLLIDNNDFQIINMRKSTEETLPVLINFLKNNNFSREDVFLYLEEYFKIVEINKKGIIWDD